MPHATSPAWTWAGPGAAALCAAALLAAVFAAVHHAERVAHRIGEPFGTLVLTLFNGVVTLGTGRTTVLQGAVHLTIFAAYLILAVVP